MDIFVKFFSQYTITKQLTIIFLYAVLIPTLTLGSMGTIYSCHNMANSYKDLTMSDAIRIRSILLNITTNFFDISEQIATNDSLTTLLSTNYSSSEEAIISYNNYNHFRTLLNNYPSISTIKMYIPQDYISEDRKNLYFFPISKDIQGTTWYQKAITQASHFWSTNVRKDRFENNYWELNFYKRILIPNTNQFAILNMTVSDIYLRNQIENNTFSTYLMVNDNPTFYSTYRDKPGTLYPITLDYDDTYYSESGYMTINQKKVIGSVITFKPYRSSDTIYILSFDPKATFYVGRLGLFYLGTLCIFSLIIFGAFLLFIKYFSTRIQTLRLAMNRVTHNDYELIDSVQGNDELSAIFKDLKTMIIKVQIAEAKIYENQIKRQQLENQQQQMEFKMLTSQINPHFLYNTLETIRMKAFSEGNLEVATAIKLLGKSLRYVLNSTVTTSTTLDKELNYINMYLSIQKLRFGKRLNYEVIIDKNIILKNHQILPLLLQPVVENAISHGIEHNEINGQVIIKFTKQLNFLLIEISDNGIGMTKKELEELNYHIQNHPKNSTSSIGLYNINQRIKLYYGEEYGLEIHSLKEKGTLVTIKIPLHNLWEETI